MPFCVYWSLSYGKSVTWNACSSASKRRVSFVHHQVQFSVSFFHKFTKQPNIFSLNGREREPLIFLFLSYSFAQFFSPCEEIKTNFSSESSGKQKFRHQPEKKNVCHINAKSVLRMRAENLKKKIRWKQNFFTHNSVYRLLSM